MFAAIKQVSRLLGKYIVRRRFQCSQLFKQVYRLLGKYIVRRRFQCSQLLSKCLDSREIYCS